jgi:ribose 1,5-bisphosphokinase PhnN
VNLTRVVVVGTSCSGKTTGRLIAGARNHLRANRPLEFGFEITVRGDEIGAEREFEPVFR